MWVVINVKSFLMFLSSDLSNQSEIMSVILFSFSSTNEEVKAAASYALGEKNIVLFYADKSRKANTVAYTDHLFS